MTREDITSLLLQIKIFYPRFESVEKVDGEFRVNPAVVNAWHKSIGWMAIERAMQILNRYLESEDGSRAPQIALWIRNGRAAEKAVETTMTLDRRNNVVIWQPEPGGDRFEIPVRWAGDCWEDQEGRLYALPEMG